ncbi:MAG: hypothetical protein AB7I37_19545 [Pirellulales bacterium]
MVRVQFNSGDVEIEGGCFEFGGVGHIREILSEHGLVSEAISALLELCQAIGENGYEFSFAWHQHVYKPIFLRIVELLPKQQGRLTAIVDELFSDADVILDARELIEHIAATAWRTEFDTLASTTKELQCEVEFREEEIASGIKNFLNAAWEAATHSCPTSDLTV